MSKDDNNDKRDENPFVAFRRFADEQISAAFAGLSELPTMVEGVMKSLESKPHRHAFDDTRETEKPFTSANIQEASPSQCADKNDTMSSLASACPVEAEPKQLRNFTPHPVFSSLPFDHILFLWRSPYSPIHLERDTVLQNSGIRWRDACEDLILVQQGQSMPDRNVDRNGQDNQSPNDWILGMFSKGLTTTRHYKFVPHLPFGFDLPFIQPNHFDLMRVEDVSKRLVGAEAATVTSPIPPVVEANHGKWQWDGSPRSNPEALDESKLPVNRGDSVQTILSTTTYTSTRESLDGSITTSTNTTTRYKDGSSESVRIVSSTPRTRPRLATNESPTPKGHNRLLEDSLTTVSAGQAVTHESKKREQLSEPATEKGKQPNKSWFWSW